MKRRLFLILALSLLLMPALAARASVVSGAYYLTTVRVTNNSTATTLVSTNFTLSTADMISAGMLNATATDVAMRDGTGNDVAFMPGWSTNPWVAWVPTIGANSQINQYLYSNNASGGKIRFFGTLSVPDAANLEHGANFTDTFSGYVDTSVTDNLISKAGAYAISSGSGNITAGIYGSAGALTQTLYPVATGNYTNIASVVGAATHWGAVDDPSGAPDDDVTYVYNDA